MPLSIILLLSIFVSDDALLSFFFVVSTKSLNQDFLAILCSDRFLLITFTYLMLRFPENNLLIPFFVRILLSALSNSRSLDFLLLLTHSFLPILLRISQSLCEFASNEILEPLTVLITKIACLSCPSFNISSLSDLFPEDPPSLEMSEPSAPFLDLLSGLFSRITPSSDSLSIFSGLRDPLSHHFSEKLSEWGVLEIENKLTFSVSAFRFSASISSAVFRIPLECSRDCLTVAAIRPLCLPSETQWFDSGFQPAFIAATDSSPFVRSESPVASKVNGIRSLLGRIQLFDYGWDSIFLANDSICHCAGKPMHGTFSVRRSNVFRGFP
jgi:hypothetical protein